MIKIQVCEFAFQQRNSSARPTGIDVRPGTSASNFKNEKYYPPVRPLAKDMLVVTVEDHKLQESLRQLKVSRTLFIPSGILKLS